MAKLLVIQSSPRSASISNQLTETYVQKWRQKNPDGSITRHNVALEQTPFLTEEAIVASFTPAEARTPEQQQTLALSDALVEELLEADTLIIGSPMWNFGISAALKAWIDQIVRPGKTVKVSGHGFEGMLDPSKTVIVVAARGGAFTGDSAYASYDLQEPYLRTILGFIGLTNVKFVYAENLNRGGDAAALGIKNGEEALLQMV